MAWPENPHAIVDGHSPVQSKMQGGSLRIASATPPGVGTLVVGALCIGCAVSFRLRLEARPVGGIRERVFTRPNTTGLGFFPSAWHSVFSTDGLSFHCLSGLEPGDEEG